MQKYFWLLLALFTVFTSSAVEVNDLYQAKVVVKSQSTSDREIALKKAMEIVLLKVGARQEILSQPEIRQAVNSFQQYLSQYGYQRIDNNNVLEVNFNEQKINQLFQDNNLPIWGNLRPKILLWLVEEDGLRRRIIGESADNPFPQIIEDFSSVSGLPISMPLMDLTDIGQIVLADIWGRFAEPIRQASSRYLAEASVVIRFSNASLLPSDEVASNCAPLCRQQYMLDWSLVAEQQHFGQQYQGQDPYQLLQTALEDIRQLIYQDYAHKTDNSRQLLIDVANIDNLPNYVAVADFLQSLSSVDSVQLIKAKGQNRRFSLTLLGSKSAFLSALKLNKQLKQYVDPLADPNEQTIPVFYWGAL